MKKVIEVTGRENPRNGANELYSESTTLRDSPAFDLLKLIGLRALKWMGMEVDRGLDALGIGRYFRTLAGEGQVAYSVYKPNSRLAAGYRMAMARQAASIPPSVYRSRMTTGNALKWLYQDQNLIKLNPGYRRVA